MKVHIQKKHKSKNLQLDHLSQRNEQGHVNKPASSRSQLGLTAQSLGGPGLNSCAVRDSGFFLASCWWYHMISSYSGTSRIYSGDINSNRNGVYVRKTTLYALPHFCKSFFRPCSTTWTTSLVFTRRKTDEAINFDPSIWARTRSPQISYVQPYFPTFK